MGLIWSNEGPSRHTTCDATPNLMSGEPEEAEAVERKKRREEELSKLKEELAEKRELRRRKLGEVSEELRGLKEELDREKEKRREAEERLEEKAQDGKEEGARKQLEEARAEIEEARREATEAKKLATEARQELEMGKQAEERLEERAQDGKEEEARKQLEEARAEIEEARREATEAKRLATEARRELETAKQADERTERLETQVRALKDVANIGKELLRIRELQVTELSSKLKAIEETGIEYEKEVATMRKLRSLYEERARATLMEHKMELERERARVSVVQAKLTLAEEANGDLTEKNQQLEKKVTSLDKQVDDLSSRLSDTRIELATKSEHLYHATSQMSLINNLISQVISGPEIDLDRLATFLEENHSLINEITSKGDINNVASVLAGIAGGVEGCEPTEEQQKIASNLGKVWRVLVELLSHHTKMSNSQTPEEWDSCYKSIDTPKGPKIVISVSQTFIKLKDLILEKNSLVKEVGRLKKLNEHLETRMEEQENRLTLVTAELHNTWGVVNKLRAQHDNLHTHEKILRYELQHKRMMLTDLKKQLEICREQWAMAREKNSQTERDWKKLRAEFALRKRQQFGSAESGYEDEEVQSPEDDTTDEEKSLAEDKSTDVNKPVSSTANNEPNVKQDMNKNDENMQDTEEIIPTSQNKEITLEVPETDKSSEGSLSECKSKHNLILPETQQNINICQTETSKLSLPAESLDIRLQGMGNTHEINAECEQRLQEGAEMIKEDVSNILEEPLEKRLLCKENTPNKTDSLTCKSVDLEERLKDPGNTDVCSSKESVEERLQCPEGTTESIVPHKEGHHTEVRLTEESEGADEGAKGSQSTDEPPGTSRPKTFSDELLKRREERLRRMEESCKSLMAKMGHTSSRSEQISDKLDRIHAQYGPQQETAKPDSSETVTLNESTSSNQAPHEDI